MKINPQYVLLMKHRHLVEVISQIWSWWYLDAYEAFGGDVFATHCIYSFFFSSGVYHWTYRLIMLHDAWPVSVVCVQWFIESTLFMLVCIFKQRVLYFWPFIFGKRMALILCSWWLFVFQYLEYCGKFLYCSLTMNLNEAWGF